MYRVIKVLNNNGILVYSNETGREMILLGNGVGFGRKPTEKIGPIPGAKVYSLVSRRKDQSVLKVVNGIRPEFIEAAGKIIEEAEKEFGEVNHDILLPLQRNGRQKTGRCRIRLPLISVSCLQESTE